MVVGVGLGEEWLVSRNSIGRERRGKAIALVLLVSGGVMVVAGARDCTALLGFRYTGSF